MRYTNPRLPLPLRLCFADLVEVCSKLLVRTRGKWKLRQPNRLDRARRKTIREYSKKTIMYAWIGQAMYSKYGNGDFGSLWLGKTETSSQKL